MLRRYKREFGRYRHLAVESDVLESKYNRLRREMVANEAAPQAQVITDMPRGGNRVGSKVEDIAVKIADGWMSPEVKTAYDEWQAVRNKAEEARVCVVYVEAWLEGLTEREKWIVRHQFINGEYWADICDDYDRLFGKDLSKDTLKRLRDRALERIYDAAECKRAD